jgi:hypothetical protein
MKLVHFLLVYDLRERRLAVKEFDDPVEATEAYGLAEAQHLGDSDTEIVLIGSDSIDTVKKTHGHYFNERDTIELPLA